MDDKKAFSVLDRYGTNVTKEAYITNPAIGREKQIKELILILLTPEKSAILIGKPGIGKTAIVEGLAYKIQKDEVPEALKGYTIINIKTASLLGTMPDGESKVQIMIDELKQRDKLILFVDEIHMLIGATDSSSLDFANIFKEGLGRGSIKVIGATTTEEYERYILRDKAFTRRFQKVDVPEPTKEEVVQIMMGTLPKIEKTTGRKLKYSNFQQSQIMKFVVDMTDEYKRVFAIGSRYPDISLTIMKQAFSYAVFDNREWVDIFDFKKALENSKNIYPDVIRKEMPKFDVVFKDIIAIENGEVTDLDIHLGRALMPAEDVINEKREKLEPDLEEKPVLQTMSRPNILPNYNPPEEVHMTAVNPVNITAKSALNKRFATTDEIDSVILSGTINTMSKQEEEETTDLQADKNPNEPAKLEKALDYFKFEKSLKEVPINDPLEDPIKPDKRGWKFVQELDNTGVNIEDHKNVEPKQELRIIEEEENFVDDFFDSKEE